MGKGIGRETTEKAAQQGRLVHSVGSGPGIHDGFEATHTDGLRETRKKTQMQLEVSPIGAANIKNPWIKTKRVDKALSHCHRKAHGGKRPQDVAISNFLRDRGRSEGGRDSG